MADPRLRGIAMARAKIVTPREARIRDSIPNSGGSEVGCQELPKINSKTPTVLKTGNPSVNRVRVMPRRNRQDSEAKTGSSLSIRFFFIIIL
jgi:hypothetical protein